MYGLCEHYFLHCPKARALYSCRSKVFCFYFTYFQVSDTDSNNSWKPNYCKITICHNYLYLKSMYTLSTFYIMENLYLMMAYLPLGKSQMSFINMSGERKWNLNQKCITFIKAFSWMVYKMVWKQIQKKGSEQWQYPGICLPINQLWGTIVICIVSGKAYKHHIINVYVDTVWIMALTPLESGLQWAFVKKRMSKTYGLK